MFRKLQVLVGVCFLTWMAGSAFAGDLPQPVASVSLEAEAAAGETEAKKKMKPRPYAEVLQKKLKKAEPTKPEPKYKAWDKVVTKDHKKHEGLLTLYTKQEELLLEVPRDRLDKPMLAILSLSQGIGSDFVYGGLPVDDIMFDLHRDEDHIQLRRLSLNFRAGDDEALKRTLDLTFSESILESFAIKSEKGDNVVIDVREFFLSDIAGMSMWLGGALNQPMRADT
jgi:hypothetical protein